MSNFFNIPKDNKILQKWYFLSFGISIILFFTIFVVQELSEEKSDIYFFTIRKRSWVSNFERVASPIFDSSCSPEGAFAYNLISDMQERNPIVTTSAHAGVTSIQQILVNNNFNLKKPDGFLRCYYALLPYFKTQNDAFGYVNLIAFKRHNAFSFLNLQSFKSAVYG